MRSKQTARKAVPSAAPAFSLRMRPASGKKAAAVSSTIERTSAASKTKARAPAAGSTDGQAVVDHTRSTPYEGPDTTREVYDSQKLANAAVMRLWDEFKAGYSLEECQLFKNKAGFCKFFMRDEVGTEDTYEAKPHVADLEWELVEEGESATAGF